MERLRAMLQGGTIRRVRQTLLATNLAQGALVAWQVPADKLDAAFEYMFQQDPFSGHVVLRSTDTATAGSNYKLVDDAQSAARFFAAETLRVSWRGKRARSIFGSCRRKRLFALGVGHVRRRGHGAGGASADVPAEVTEVAIVELNELEWRVLTALKREFGASELMPDLWRRAGGGSGCARWRLFMKSRRI